MTKSNFVVWFKDVGLTDLGLVGGKNASLGEMLSKLSQSGIRVPDGFATTSSAYLDFLKTSGIDLKIDQLLTELDSENISQLASTGRTIRELIMSTALPERLEREVRTAYAELSQDFGQEFAVAVRSSATAEDLPEASFAGQQETFLNVRGIDNVLVAIHRVFASLFTDRAISYRVHHRFNHKDVLLSAGIQRMIRSDLGSSGVMFTLDTESGFDKVVFITSAYGLGEIVVQGAVNPDEFYLFKPALESKRPAIVRRVLGQKAIKGVYTQDATIGKTISTVNVESDKSIQFSISDSDAEELGQIALTIEKHYGRPMDIEWGKDGQDGKIYILQARPETVKSRKKLGSLERYTLKERSAILARGRAIGQKIGKGKVSLIKSVTQIDRFEPGTVLVTDMTDPDWEPIMKRAAAIVTNRGGRTCHAAIIARELGIPAVVGCEDVTETLQHGQSVTVSCAEGDTGFIYEGSLKSELTTISLDNLPNLPVKLCMNVANPELAFEFQQLPNAGVGLARLEFIIARGVGIHPRAALEFNKLSAQLKAEISAKTAAYGDPVNYYVERLAEGIATIAAAFHPKPVIVRMSDFKSNEYSGLLGGDLYEPKEENPMIGFRGAARYISENFRPCFELECRAIRRVRDEIGLTNVEVMIPFVRTLDEARGVVEVLEANGLKRGVNGLKYIMMCEVPSNALLAEEFLEYFDGFSIGSNDLTQLTLGVDRDSGIMAGSFDERDPAVKALLSLAIGACNKKGKYIGICGQGPSDYPDFAAWLMTEGIGSISLNPDSVVDTWVALGKAKVS